MSEKKRNPVMNALTDFWRNCMLSLKIFLYGIAIVFFVIGVMALFQDAAGLGIVLMVFNAGLILLFRKLDKLAGKKFDRDFEEMVRRNRGEE